MGTTETIVGKNTPTFKMLNQLINPFEIYSPLQGGRQTAGRTYLNQIQMLLTEDNPFIFRILDNSVLVYITRSLRGMI